MSTRAANAAALRSCAAPYALRGRRNPSPTAPRPLQLTPYSCLLTLSSPGTHPNPPGAEGSSWTPMQGCGGGGGVKGAASELAGSRGLRGTIYGDIGGRGVCRSCLGLAFSVPPRERRGWCNFCGFQQPSPELCSFSIHACLECSFRASASPRRFCHSYCDLKGCAESRTCALRSCVTQHSAARLPG